MIFTMKSKILWLLPLPLVLLLAAAQGRSPSPGAATAEAGLPVDISLDGDHITVTISGQASTNFYTGDPYPKPFLYPLRSADGRIVTRAFPIQNVEGESRDHPHHRGLFIGLGSINGVNFWENEKAYTTPNRGTMVLTSPATLTSGSHRGTIEANFSWRDPKGQELLTEHRIMTFSGTSDQRVIDFDLTFKAVQDLNFGDTKEGFFAIRVADSMAEDKGGQMMASTGFTTEKGVWGRPADWVQYSGSVDKKPISITIFDNPNNLNHPERWHSRAYGLFAVNPFGLKEFDKAATGAGGFFLKSGSTVRFRYRVLICDTPLTADQEKGAYAVWSK
jgi:Methane oxygenase PmoA